MRTPQLEKVCQSDESGVDSKRSTAQADWLSWLHEMLPDTADLMLFKVNPNQSIEIAALTNLNLAPTEAITNAALSCVHRKQARYLDALPAADHHLLGIPIQIQDSSTVYVMLMLTEPLNKVQQSTAIKLTHWAATRLQEEPLNNPANASSPVGPEVQLAQSMIGAFDQHGTFTALAFTLVNKLARLCGCARVSLGSYDGKKLQLVAISGQPKIDDRRLIARQLCALMQETIQVGRAVYPVIDEHCAPAVQAYFKSQGERPLLSFVMRGAQTSKFILVLERSRHEHFMEAQSDAIEHSVDKLAPLLELAQMHELPLRQKIQHAFYHALIKLTRFNQWSRKRWLVMFMCAFLLCSFFIPITHRVSATAVIEASDRQVLVAAQDGFILSAHAQAGEEVAKGDLLATLDGQNIELEVEKWRSEKAKNQQQYAQALAVHDRSELSRLRADVQRIDAEIALLEQQLRRGEVRAPFDGVLLEGDWTQSLGAPVATGDVLFEIASAEQYRLILEVDEHDIGHIKPEQLAHLRMAALPTTVWQAELGDVMPVAISEKGSSAFRVPALIDGEASALRPGMEGVGKVSIGKRSMFWVYSHELVEKIRYLAWKIGWL